MTVQKPMRQVKRKSRKQLLKHYKKERGKKQLSEVWIMKRTREAIKRRRQQGKGLDIQLMLNKTSVKFHLPGYQFLGPGTKLKKRLARGDPGKNRLERIAKQHDIDYSRAKSLQDKWVADAKRTESINRLPGKKTLTEKVIRKIMKAKKRMKL